ncbi:hypothetical protein [Salmonella phage SSBI34]|nr:hypothetical protein [Salmonella phage SSBI34]
MSKEEQTKYPRIRPTVRFEDFPTPRAIQEHPAYGIISISHPSGGNVEMFGSDLKHNERISLQIDVGYEETAYGIPEYRTAPRRTGRIVEVEMTSFQWAALVACHSGRGVPCTLRHVKGEPLIPLIENQNTSEEMANIDIEASLKNLVKDFNIGLQDLRDLVAKGKANKGELTNLLSKLSRLHNRLPETTAHALSTFKENSEVIVTKAQAEVEATINNLIVRTGIKALGGNMEMLEGPKDD